MGVNTITTLNCYYNSLASETPQTTREAIHIPALNVLGRQYIDVNK